MTIVLGIACAVLFLGAVGMTAKVKRLEAAADEARIQEMAAVFERSRIEGRARDLLVPLTWVWDLGPREGLDGIDRLRLYLVAAYTEVQKALLLDDLEMADAMATARLQEPPRRLPKYPQVPAYLASAADVVGMPSFDYGFSAHGQGETVDPAEDLHSFTCAEGHRTTVHQSVDLSGEPCQVASEEDPGQPCRKVLLR